MTGGRGGEGGQRGERGKGITFASQLKFEEGLLNEATNPISVNLPTSADLRHHVEQTLFARWSYPCFHICQVIKVVVVTRSVLKT